MDGKGCGKKTKRTALGRPGAAGRAAFGPLIGEATGQAAKMSSTSRIPKQDKLAKLAGAVLNHRRLAVMHAGLPHDAMCSQARPPQGRVGWAAGVPPLTGGTQRWRKTKLVMKLLRKTAAGLALAVCAGVLWADCAGVTCTIRHSPSAMECHEGQQRMLEGRTLWFHCD